MRRVLVISFFLILLICLGSVQGQIYEGNIDLTMSDVATLDASLSINFTALLSLFENPFIRDIIDTNEDSEVSHEEVQAYFFESANQTAINWDEFGDDMRRSFMLDFEFPESIDVKETEVWGLDGPVDNFTVINAFLEFEFTLHFDANDDSTHKLVMGVTEGEVTDRITYSFTAPEGWWITSVSGLAEEDINGGQVEGIIAEDSVVIEFTNEENPEEDFATLCISLMMIVIIISKVIAAIVAFFSLRKTKKTTQGTVPPQTFQVTCYNCRNLIQINDPGYNINVTCPFCYAALAVESRIAAARAAPRVPAPYPPPPPKQG